MACLFFHFFNPTGNEYSLDLEKKCFAVVAGYVCSGMRRRLHCIPPAHIFCLNWRRCWTSQYAMPNILVGAIKKRKTTTIMLPKIRLCAYFFVLNSHCFMGSKDTSSVSHWFEYSRMYKGLFLQSYVHPLKKSVFNVADLKLDIATNVLIFFLPLLRRLNLNVKYPIHMFDVTQA